jgi:hypothetical protein
MLPLASLVNMAGELAVHRIASSFVSRSLDVGTELAVYDLFGLIFCGMATI